jgi:DNA-nicking Smr family endonuclease
MAKTPKPRKSPSAKPALIDDEAGLFDSAMRDVKKFDGKRGRPVPPPNTISSAPKPSPPNEKLPSVPSLKSIAALPTLAAGTSADVDSRTLDRLRRGRLRPEARLDLHGMTQDKAHRALNRFIAEAQSSGVRSTIIITGKGRISEGGGVLRNQVPQWLNAPGIRPSILAFAPAQPKDGGAGALYVLLRRRR